MADKNRIDDEERGAQMNKIKQEAKRKRVESTQEYTEENTKQEKMLGEEKEIEKEESFSNF